MNNHLTWEELNDHVDGVHSPADESRCQGHLERCSDCRARLDELQATLREVANVAREIDPPQESWPALRAELERRKLVTLSGEVGISHVPPGAESSPSGGLPGAPARALPGVGPGTLSGAPSPAPARPAMWSRWRVAAAAVLLVAASSAITTLVLRSGEGTGPTVVAGTASAAILPAAVAEAEEGYLASVRELSVALDVARQELSPRTIAIVERNLALIDAAIAESREALVRDPGNRVLLDVLAGTYRQKLELLRRAAQLASS